MFQRELAQLLPSDQEVLFFCIGTDRSTGDSLGPLVGTQLSLKGYNVLGTLKSPVHALNLDENITLARNIYSNHFIIAVDACLGGIKSVGEVHVHGGPLKPGAGVGKELSPIGDVSIQGIVNVSGGMDYLTLQSTRLSVVMDLAAEIVEGVVKVLPQEQELFLGFLYKELKNDYRPSLLAE
ncbi:MULTISPECIES: spore protease YyaC [Peribacillus]|uniref:spore protease YyaC n=1 Tax=Peribacillus TaxID=2675229 RepID=UPI001F4EB900|nr:MULTISPECIES: spore protease YyaC [unclassified Peribacillus]MCK1982190.1 spore protease YyaC [Peribacillus sp. Aquil_B1]MCK2007458.1 spore protease YyaC [Peribacillus sp. Aquil_B8]